MHDWNLEKVEEPEIIHRITAKAGKFQKNIYFCFIDYAKPFDCVDHDKLWKILKKKVIPDHLTCSWGARELSRQQLPEKHLLLLN